MRDGAFDLATRLYGLRFKERRDLPRYHEDVRVIEVLEADDDHHRAEALFKGLGRALDMASQRDPRRGEDIPSTKGVLT